MSSEQPATDVGRGKIHFVELLTVDIDGQPKSMTVPITPVTSTEPLATGKIPVHSCGIDGSSVKGLAPVSDSDLQLIPDLSTIREIPGCSPRRACAFADVHQRSQSGALQLHPLASRNILGRVIKQLSTSDMTIRVKLEPEFYYLTQTGEPLNRAGYADIIPYNKGMDLLLETALDLRAAGIESKWLHSEHGEGQQEIELDFTEAGCAADNYVLFKILARHRAALHGVEVSFMPKPFPSQAGSGLHCHLQVWKGGKNILGTSKGVLSEIGQQFVAGLLEHTPAITAIANPTVNSFKRLVPEYEAPVYITWGYRNRSALVRVPLFTTQENAAIEFRSPDPLTNPYLLLASLIGAGLDGVQKQMQPPKPISENVYDLQPQELSQMNVSMLPVSLNRALQFLQKDDVLGNILGEEFCKRYKRIRRAEWYNYTRQYVTDFERKHYKNR
ncbi:MAG: glutamine synthetase family protein [Promethearchaeota archaeon]